MSNQPKKSSPSILGSCFLPLVASLVLACVLSVGVILALPGRAEEKFGPPSPRVRGFQRYLLSIQLLLNANDLTTPADLTGNQLPFQIDLGESTVSVVNRLFQMGLITNPSAMLAYLRYSGLDTSLQAGNYELSPAMSVMEIAHSMQDATPKQVILTVFAGWRIEEIARALPTTGLEISPEAFLSAALFRPEGFNFIRDIPPGIPLEGFLFPGVYDLKRDTTAPALIEAMLNRFNEQISSEVQSGFTTRGLTIFEAVTLASIVQREAVVEEESPLIASVFLNRLAVGMNLAADPTVQYAVGYNDAQQTWWTNPLSAADLQIDSPYNTYLYPGLPPTPISNPGMAALRGVAFPARTPYYYFRAACDGTGRHLFAETFEEHLKNACQP
jgi:UPF0755 protein